MVGIGRNGTVPEILEGIAIFGFFDEGTAHLLDIGSRLRL
jgi:hypothetical protein